jgi:hypothetical protein
MEIALSTQEWDELEHAQRQERGVRNWRRYQAIRLCGLCGERAYIAADAAPVRVALEAAALRTGPA